MTQIVATGEKLLRQVKFFGNCLSQWPVNREKFSH